MKFKYVVDGLKGIIEADSLNEAYYIVLEQLVHPDIEPVVDDKKG